MYNNSQYCPITGSIIVSIDARSIVVEWTRQFKSKSISHSIDCRLWRQNSDTEFFEYFIHWDGEKGKKKRVNNK